MKIAHTRTSGLLGKIIFHQVKDDLMSTSEFLVSKSGQMSVPANVRHRWGLDDGGRVVVVDLGDAVVLLPPGGREAILGSALSADDHVAFVKQLDDPDLATT
jgi:AbrB family looped-hinge helix DNA binding protein